MENGAATARKYADGIVHCECKHGRKYANNVAVERCQKFQSGKVVLNNVMRLHFS